MIYLSFFFSEGRSASDARKRGLSSWNLEGKSRVITVGSLFSLSLSLSCSHFPALSLSFSFSLSLSLSFSLSFFLLLSFFIIFSFPVSLLFQPLSFLFRSLSLDDHPRLADTDFDIVLGHFSRIAPALWHPALAVEHALLWAPADWMLVRTIRFRTVPDSRLLTWALFTSSGGPQSLHWGYEARRAAQRAAPPPPRAGSRKHSHSTQLQHTVTAQRPVTAQHTVTAAHRAARRRGRVRTSKLRHYFGKISHAFLGSAPPLHARHGTRLGTHAPRVAYCMSVGDCNPTLCPRLQVQAPCRRCGPDHGRRARTMTSASIR